MSTHQAKLGMAWYFPLLKKITNNYCRKSNTTKIQNKIELIVSVSLWSDPINSPLLQLYQKLIALDSGVLECMNSFFNSKLLNISVIRHLGLHN